MTPASSRILRGRHAGGAEADDEHVQVLEPLAEQLGRVEQRREHDDGGAVLVVVEDGDVELGLQALLDLEAARGGDVLEVDAAEGRRDRLDGGDDLVGVLGVQAQREGVDAAELLEEHRLALHHGHRGLGPDVAEAEHGAAVGDDGDGVALDRVLERLVAVLRDRAADARDAGRVGHREVVAGAQRLLVALLDLAAEVHQERAVGAVDDLRALDGVDRVGDRAPVLLVGGVDDDVAQQVLALERDQVDGADRAARVADRGRDPAEHARAVRDAHPQDERELRGCGAPWAGQ